MSRYVGLILGLGLIVWLFVQDKRTRGYASTALLVPGFWLAMIASRPVDFWLDINVGGSNVEGNPINMLGFLVPAVCAFFILARRGFSWGIFIGRNKALLLIYSFFLVSVAWSPIPLASLKRLLKDFCCVPISLVILTEENPSEAVRLVFVRVAYVLFTMSVVFIKYFPAIGRNASMKNSTMFTGVASHKNSLGELLFVLGFVMMWDYLVVRRMPASPTRKMRLRLLQITFLIGVYLLYMAHCATAVVCIGIGVAAFWVCGRLVELPQGRKYLVYGLIGVVLVAALDSYLGISKMVVEALGRNMTLTGRTEVWKGVLARAGNPVIGLGFNAFWDTSRAPDLFEEMSLNHIKSAHNGYIETYLDGGWVGVTLLVFMLLVAGKTVMDKLFSGTMFGRTAFIFWLVAIIHNMSEASFFRNVPIWMALLLFSIDYPTSYVEEPALMEEAYEESPQEAVMIPPDAPGSLSFPGQKQPTS